MTHVIGIRFFNCFSFAQIMFSLIGAPTKLIEQLSAQKFRVKVEVDSPYLEPINVEYSSVDRGDPDVLLLGPVPTLVNEVEHRP